jgi:hypothetical protein
LDGYETLQEKIKKLLDVFFRSSRSFLSFVKESFFCSCAAKGLSLNRRWGLNALLSLKPRRLFISFARTKETKQRKFAVCTFWTTPALFSAKQKELASLKQLFVFHAPKSTSASRPKSEAGPFCFYATSLRSLGVWCFLFLLRFIFSHLLH